MGNNMVTQSEQNEKEIYEFKSDYECRLDDAFLEIIELKSHQAILLNQISDDIDEINKLLIQIKNSTNVDNDSNSNNSRKNLEKGSIRKYIESKIFELMHFLFRE